MPNAAPPAYGGRRRALLGLVAGSMGCSVVARQHPCWDYASHRLQGQVPGSLVSRLARERGAERIVRGNRAPVGYYWRRIDAVEPDMRHMRQYVDGHELTACPVAVTDPKAAAASP